MNAIEQYLAPTGLEPALAALRAGDVTLLAGGTDLMPQSTSGKRPLRRTLLNLRHVRELEGIVHAGDAIRIGALATVSELLRAPLVRERLPLLAEACDHFASEQIRNAATLGGNIVNASPAGDTPVPLLAYDAEVELASLDAAGAIARRRLPLAEFFVGPGRTRLAPSELLAAVVVPLPPPGQRARFCKFGTRPALDISAVSIALAAVVTAGVARGVRVAFGAVAPTPVRARRTEAALEGRALDAAAVAAAAQAAFDEVQPIDDVRASAWYRRELIRNLTRRMLEDVARA
ncbi:MAG: carbon-monoxide dehydrogenase medium subunit [Pseudomonadota bacterium]|nr:xanthine dehydrogenase family protein subunit M [Rubrivivax sp.]